MTAATDAVPATEQLENASHTALCMPRGLCGVLTVPAAHGTDEHILQCSQHQQVRLACIKARPVDAYRHAHGRSPVAGRALAAGACAGGSLRGRGLRGTAEGQGRCEWSADCHEGATQPGAMGKGVAGTGQTHVRP